MPAGYGREGSLQRADSPAMPMTCDDRKQASGWEFVSPVKLYVTL